MHKRYLVTGRRQYRWHAPGSVFEAQLDPDAERRAIERGSIRVLAVVRPSLRDGSYQRPTTQSPPAADGKATRDAVSGSRVN